MPSVKKSNKRNGGGWSQGPPLSTDQYYLTEYKSYSECYPQVRPGFIQSNPNPELAQTPMAGGKKSRHRTRKVGGSSCREYFATRGGSKRGVSRRGGCGCLLKGGACPFMKGGNRRSRKIGGSSCREYFATRGGSCSLKGGACPFMKGGNQKKLTQKKIKGGRYMIDTGSSIGGDGPNVAPINSSIPCEAYRPMPINPHQPNELISGPDPDLRFAGLSPGAALKGGRRTHKHQKKE
jgi:hypothetical protein